MISPKSAINIVKQYKIKKAITYRIGPAEATAPPTDNATPKNIRKTIINGEKRIRRGVMITVSPTIRGPKVKVSPAKKVLRTQSANISLGIMQVKSKQIILKKRSLRSNPPSSQSNLP